MIKTGQVRQMDKNDSDLKTTINRLVWMLIFITVAAALVILEWQDNRYPWMGWFLAAGMWSAICGIGYSVCDWILQRNTPVKIVSVQDKTTADELREKEDVPS